jgi:hypothetical protein
MAVARVLVILRLALAVQAVVVVLDKILVVLQLQDKVIKAVTLLLIQMAQAVVEQVLQEQIPQELLDQAVVLVMAELDLTLILLMRLQHQLVIAVIMQVAAVVDLVRLTRNQQAEQVAVAEDQIMVEMQ